MILLSTLKKSLSECHSTKDDKHIKMLQDVTDPKYYLLRVMECIHACQDGEDIQENTKLAIQLLNMYRCHYGAIHTQGEQKIGAGSKDSGGNNIGSENS